MGMSLTLKQKETLGEIETKLLYAGEENCPWGAHRMPVFDSSTYGYKTIKEAREAMQNGWVYQRIDCPNYQVIEKKLAVLEGEAALTFRSGLAAIRTTVETLAGGAGHHIVSNFPLYGGTKGLFTKLLGKYGLEFSFVDARDPLNVAKAIRENTTIIYIETPTNPTLYLADIKAISLIAKKINPRIFVIVDNTFATPLNQQPLKLGADVSVHSATKYLSGHGDIVAGAVMSSKEIIAEIKANRTLEGNCSTPENAAKMSEYIKTFVGRIVKHNYNALMLARFLEEQPEVKRVYFSGLCSNPQYKLACRQMRGPAGLIGFGGVVSFELNGDKDTLDCFLDNLPFPKGVSLGFVDEIVENSPTMTQISTSKEERGREGITDNFIRVSVGTGGFAGEGCIRESFQKAFKTIRR